jgi:hypothetical protein
MRNIGIPPLVSRAAYQRRESARWSARDPDI